MSDFDSLDDYTEEEIRYGLSLMRRMGIPTGGMACYDSDSSCSDCTSDDSDDCCGTSSSDDSCSCSDCADDGAACALAPKPKARSKGKQASCRGGASPMPRKPKKNTAANKKKNVKKPVKKSTQKSCRCCCSCR